MLKSFYLFIKENVNDSLIGKIDYTLLKPESTEKDIIELCRKADILGVKSVCVLPKMVKVAAKSLKDSKVLVCTVISFPHGTDTTEQKISETKLVISDGADEVDMVFNYPLLKKMFKNENNYSSDHSPDEDIINNLINEISNLSDICHKNGKILKVIVESGLLTPDETEISTEICINSGADFIKTSTGMVEVGAELDKVKIMKKVINNSDSDMKIKASGGLRTLADLQKFDPYVDRFGVGFASVDNIFGGKEKETENY